MDAGADLDTKKSNAPSGRLSWLRLTREYTHSGSTYVGHRGVLGCLVEKNAKRSASARLFAAGLESVSAGLDAQVQGQAKCTRRGARHSRSSGRWLEFSISKNLTKVPKNHTSKQTNGPGTVSESDFAQQTFFCLHKRDLFLCPDQNMKAGIGFA